MTSPNPYTGRVRLKGWQNGLILGLLCSALIGFVLSNAVMTSVTLISLAFVGSVYWHIIPTVRWFVN